MNFPPVYVVGGRQRRSRSVTDRDPNWYGYGTGVILRVAPGPVEPMVETVAEYVSPPGTCGPDDAVLFKSASRRGDLMYCTTQTEVVVFRLPSFEQVAHVSLHQFNDVHHVVPYKGDTLLVANSGLESVVRVTMDGTVVEEWNVLGENTWEVFDSSIDYRSGVSLKPHRAHPNHLTVIDGEPWVTRFECKDVVAVGDLTRRVEVGTERIHDGVEHNGHLLLTTVDGTVVAVDPVEQRVVDRHQLNDPNDPGRVLGWCRGLLPAEEFCWVGFSRIRPTKLRQTVSWIRTGGADQAPTRIDRYRRDHWTVVESIDLEPHGVNAVFSILPVDVPDHDSQRIFG